MISAKDNLVSGTAFAELPLATAGVLANGSCLAAILGPCRLMTFRFFCSASTIVGGAATDAHDCSGLGRYIAWVGPSLLALLFVADWCLPKSLPEPVREVSNKPVIRIDSIQQPRERTVIDTIQLACRDFNYV
jgi:hypothetical protein